MSGSGLGCSNCRQCAACGEDWNDEYTELEAVAERQGMQLRDVLRMLAIVQATAGGHDLGLTGDEWQRLAAIQREVEILDSPPGTGRINAANDNR